ncbi:MAG: hypothetical protein LUF27_06235 [Lachnospiraceae bacterium]|nr:hypothetical protein [Lachnospiraceae bacterium]
MSPNEVRGHFHITSKWLKLLTGFKQQEKIAVDYFDTETADTSYKGLWEVSFTLKEF